MKTLRTIHKFHNWDLLNAELPKYRNNVRSEWVAMLDDKNLKEDDYHQYLRQYPFWLLVRTHDTYQVISKLKMGAEYVSDFALIREGYSEGTYFDFVEIESPHDQVYLKKEVPSASLTAAIQQINDWRTWLRENQNYFRKYLPSSSTRVYRNANITFTIIIGRREKNAIFQDKINEYSQNLNIRIRSFDSLTDHIEKPFPYSAEFGSSESNQLDPLLKNILANPFFVATKDSDWREMITRKPANHHFYSHAIEEILSLRNYNDLLDDFLIDEENWLTQFSI